MSAVAAASPVAELAGVCIAMYVAHGVGDRWLQTDHQAVHKGDRGSVGWVAAAAHVATYTAATAALVALVWLLPLGVELTAAGYLAGQGVSAVTHLVIDRRYTLAWFVHHVARWKITYYDRVPGGAEHLDQSAHHVWLFAGALVTVLL